MWPDGATRVGVARTAALRLGKHHGMAPVGGEDERGRAHGRVDPDRALRAVARFVPRHLWSAVVIQDDGAVRVHFGRPDARDATVFDGSRTRAAPRRGAETKAKMKGGVLSPLPLALALKKNAWRLKGLAGRMRRSAVCRAFGLWRRTLRDAGDVVAATAADTAQMDCQTPPRPVRTPSSAATSAPPDGAPDRSPCGTHWENLRKASTAWLIGYGKELDSGIAAGSAVDGAATTLKAVLGILKERGVVVPERPAATSPPKKKKKKK